MSGGGGDKALVAGPLKKELFCGFPKKSILIFINRKAKYFQYHTWNYKAISDKKKYIPIVRSNILFSSGSSLKLRKTFRHFAIQQNIKDYASIHMKISIYLASQLKNEKKLYTNFSLVRIYMILFIAFFCVFLFLNP